MLRRNISQISIRECLAFQMRYRRLEMGLSQEKLAELAGLHRTYISDIERAERNISIDNVEKIANALEIDAARLLSPPGDGKANSHYK